MGKGDKKTKRGKIVNKSYGKRRPRKTKKDNLTEVTTKAKNASPKEEVKTKAEPKPKAAPKEKAEAKPKAAPKKTAPKEKPAKNKE